MPAASCRIMPARSISRCETISASFGFSFRMGRKNRDNRMGQLKESVGYRKRCSETGSGTKIQGRELRKTLQKCGFGAVFGLVIVRTVRNDLAIGNSSGQSLTPGPPDASPLRISNGLVANMGPAHFRNWTRATPD